MELLVVAGIALTFAAGAASPAAVTRATLDADRPFDARAVPVDRVPGQALVQLRGIDGAQLQLPRPGSAAATALKDLGARTGVVVTLVRPLMLGWALVEVRDAQRAQELPSEADTLLLIERLERDALVAAASPNKWMRPLLRPNDPGLPQMWHLDMIDAEGVWDITTGQSAQRVGVVDTGLLRNHEDVGARAVFGHDFISNTGAANDGGGRDADFADSCGGPNNFHGTHVAGTIGATTNNNIGVAGLNWAAGLVIVRGLGCGGGDIADIMEGAAWLAGANINGVPAVGANKVSVLNMSLGGGGGCSSFEQQAIDFINGQGTIAVIAAGNDGGAVNSPGNCNGVVTVGAHGPSGNRATYSSFDDRIEIVGPGGQQGPQADGVLSSIGPNSNSYAFLEGTSMAAPHVAGVISLMQARNPALTLSEVTNLLVSTGVACGNCQGKPRMDARAAVAAVTVGGPVEPPPPPLQDDALEENDTFEQARAVTCGADLDLVALASDRDWYFVDLAAEQEITVDIAAQNGADLDLYFTSGGALPDDVLARSESTTGTESLTGRAGAGGGRVFILVNPFVNDNGVSATGPYSLQVACSGAPTEPTEPTEPTDPTNPVDPVDPVDPDVGINPGVEEDALEGNNDVDSAQELFCGETRLLAARDDDWFIVEVREGDILSTATSSGDLLLTTSLFGSDGTTLLGSGTSTATTPVLSGGTVYIKVAAVDDVGGYRLRVNCAGAPAPVLDIRGGCSAAQGASPVAALGLLLLALRRRRR